MPFSTVKDILKLATKDPSQSAKPTGPKPGGFGGKPNAGPPPAGMADSASGTPATEPAGGIDQFKSRAVPPGGTAFKPEKSDGVQGPVKPGMIPAQKSEGKFGHGKIAEPVITPLPAVKEEPYRNPGGSKPSVTQLTGKPSVSVAPQPATQPKPQWMPGSWKPGQPLPSAGGHSLVRGGKAGSSDNGWS